MRLGKAVTLYIFMLRRPYYHDNTTSWTGVFRASEFFFPWEGCHGGRAELSRYDHIFLINGIPNQEASTS